MPKTTQNPQTSATARPLRNGGRARELTNEDRAKGGRTKAARQRELQAEARQLMVEQLAAQMAKATRVVGDALDAEVESAPDHRTRLTAADRVFDRVAGKPIQGVEHSGPQGQPIVVEHRERLTLREGLERIAARRRTASPANN